MRDSQQAANTAGTAAGGYGATAGGIGANVIPFLTRQLTNPQGESQRDIGSQLTQSLAGTGGATAGLTGAAGKMSMDGRNPVGFSGALDVAAMQRDKGNAMAGEKVAANNAEVKLNQQSTAGADLSKLYGMSTQAQGEQAGVQAKDLQTANQLTPAWQVYMQMQQNAEKAAAAGGG
jgi:hypothetical protein